MKTLLLPLALLPGPATPPAPAIALPGYWHCQGRLLTGSRDALACYARTQGNCQRGLVVLAYEKCLSQPAEKARYAIADTIQLRLSYPTNDLFISSCPGPGGQLQSYIVLCRQPALGKKYLRSVRRAWRVRQGRLVEVPAGSLKCLNEDVGA